MAVVKLIDLSLFAQLVLIHLFLHNLRNSNFRDPSTRFFLSILIAIFINNALELSSWIFIGSPHRWAYYLNYFIISSLLALNSVPAAIWIRYIDYKIFRDVTAANKRLVFYLIPFYISVVMLIVNLFTSFVFNFSDDNIYTRNWGMYIIPVMSLSMVLLVFLASLRYRKEIQGRILNAIMWYLLIPVSAALLQIVFFGIPLIWPAFTLATLISFNLIEVDTFLKDPLTKLDTRGKFENRLSYMLRRKNAFSIVMIDLNDFKVINDTFGHKEGDSALVVVSSILKHCIKRHDTICRYGGDEFMLLIESTESDASQTVIDRINAAITVYNDKMIRPYLLSLSCGSTYIPDHNHTSLKDILANADETMYRDKRATKKEGYTILRN